MNAQIWILKIINRYNLEKPDGRPLYQYRVTSTEFDELQKLIKANTSYINSNRQLKAIIVFYAAEWWRRHYEGKWRWEDIFNSVSLDINTFSSNERNNIIESGLLYWNRQVRKFNRRSRFLGTVATEGGLPLKQFSSSGGWLQKILNIVIKKHLNKRFAISTLIESYSENIPFSYKSIEIKQILEDIVEIVVSLRKQYQLAEKNEPLKWLEENVKDWREDFPLPIDNEVAKVLLGELVTTAATAEMADTAYADTLFSLERFIKSTKTPVELTAKLELPSSIPLELMERENLPSRVDLEVVADTGETWFWCYGTKTFTSYKLRGQAFMYQKVGLSVDCQLELSI